MKKNKRVILIGALLLLLISLMILWPITSCGSNAPELAEVKDTYIALIEDSYAINEIFFGDGLSTVARGDEHAMMYSNLPEGYSLYEIVDIEDGYVSVAAIKDAAAKVYSEEYLTGIYTMAFDGYSDGTKITTARYLEVAGYLLRYAYGEEDSFNMMEGRQRRFLFDTMKIIRPSSEDDVNIEIDSYLIGDEDNILTLTLNFILEDGVWRLNSPTY